MENETVNQTENAQTGEATEAADESGAIRGNGANGGNAGGDENVRDESRVTPRGFNTGVPFAPGARKTLSGVEAAFYARNPQLHR
jgi:hypothetical protein